MAVGGVSADNLVSDWAKYSLILVASNPASVTRTDAQQHTPMPATGHDLPVRSSATRKLTPENGVTGKVVLPKSLNPRLTA